MPLYDYRCTECDREVEVMHGIHDSGPEACEECGGAMRKALSSPAIHFKGSGWAKKDAAAASAKKAKPKASSSSDKKTPASDKAGSGADSATTASDTTGTDAATPSSKASSSTSGTAD